MVLLLMRICRHPIHCGVQARTDDPEIYRPASFDDPVTVNREEVNRSSSFNAMKIVDHTASDIVRIPAHWKRDIA